MTIKPSIEFMKEEFEDKLDWISVNTKEDPKAYAPRLGISVVPSFVVFKGDTEIGRYSGTQLSIVYQLIRKALTT